MSQARSYARANVAAPDKLRPQGGAVGYKPAAPQGPTYYPTRGAWLANRLIVRHPQAIVRSLRRAHAWINDLTHVDTPAYGLMTDFYCALNEFVEPRGEMAVFLRCNH